MITYDTIKSNQSQQRVYLRHAIVSRKETDHMRIFSVLLFIRIRRVLFSLFTQALFHYLSISSRSIAKLFSISYTRVQSDVYREIFCERTTRSFGESKETMLRGLVNRSSARGQWMHEEYIQPKKQEKKTKMMRRLSHIDQMGRCFSSCRGTQQQRRNKQFDCTESDNKGPRF